MLIGDFNAYMSCIDKQRGSQPNAIAMRQFNDCIMSVNLMAAEFVGDRYTWENNLLKERIDWAFMNAEWMSVFPLTKFHHLKKFGSDHKPILLKTSHDITKVRKPPPFRCQAAWVLEEGFSEIIQQAWRQGSWLENVKKHTDVATVWNKERVDLEKTQLAQAY